MRSIKTFARYVVILLALLISGSILESQPFETRMIVITFLTILLLAYAANKRINELSNKPQFKCTFRKEIYSHKSNEEITTLEIQCTLPFVPLVGMAIAERNPLINEEEMDDYDSGIPLMFYTDILESVTYLGNGNFSCGTKPQKLESDKKLMEALTYYYAAGWEFLISFDIKEQFEKYVDEQLALLKDATELESQKKQQKFTKIKAQLKKHC